MYKHTGFRPRGHEAPLRPGIFNNGAGGSNVGEMGGRGSVQGSGEGRSVGVEGVGSDGGNSVGIGGLMTRGVDDGMSMSVNEAPTSHASSSDPARGSGKDRAMEVEH